MGAIKEVTLRIIVVSESKDQKLEDYDSLAGTTKTECAKDEGDLELHSKALTHPAFSVLIFAQCTLRLLLSDSVSIRTCKPLMRVKRYIKTQQAWLASDIS